MNKRKIVGYMAPGFLLLPVPDVDADSVICASFGEEGHAGGDIEIGDEYQLG